MDIVNRDEQSNEDRHYIRGEILFVIYENANDNFSIAKVKVNETNLDYTEKDIVAKGHFINLQKGVSYDFFGELITHNKFGLQLDVSSYKTFIPETKDAVIHYLASGMFAGVGKKTAETIVQSLGEAAITKILNNPKVLNDLPKISEKVKGTLLKKLQENQGFERVAVELNKYNIGLKMAQNLYNHYKETTLTVITENPYKIMFDIEGFSFVMADRIAAINKIEKSAKNRIQGSCIHALQMSVADGHVFLPVEDCVKEMKKTLQVSELTEADLIAEITHLYEEEIIVLEEENVYLRTLYFAEKQFSNHVQRIIDEKIETEITNAELLKIIGAIEEEDTINYGDEQFQAIEQALQHKLLILTGGPGTGKTTVIKGIIKAYSEIHDLSLHKHDYDKGEDFPFILTAPTGRAAKRLAESTNMEAMTIHRLLGWDGNNYFEKNENERLVGKLIIIDEFSMVDTWLANHLFKAIPDDMQVLIVGDEDQLPSVGPGQVLAELLSSNTVPTSKLTEVYRQQEGSKIIEIAHKIKNDDLTIFDIEKAGDFSFIPCPTSQTIELITTVIERALQKGISFSDIQVLAPMYKSNAGINEINIKIQELVNPHEPKKRERVVNDVIYRIGDRVIQLVNQPEDGVYNGDIGEIVQIFSAKENAEKEEQIIIRFDEKDVVYNRSTYLNFMHAYCISIHKSQGSEFPIVILPVVRQYRRMLRKNLLYTAITRSKETLIMCGDIDAFIYGIETIDTNQRYTKLAELLKAGIAKNDSISSETGENKNLSSIVFDSDEEEDNISPYDFM